MNIMYSLISYKEFMTPFSLGLSLGLRVRGVALQRDRGAASRRGAVSLEELAR